MKFRDLTAEDIDVRVQSAKQNGAILLLYKNARVDMAILDETVMPHNWQREHYECKGNLFCRVGIRTCLKENEAVAEWVWKSDCGTESNTDAQKGEASDSFKRACFNWGIGRELYTSPFIWVKADECTIYDTGRKDKYNKPIYACNDKFTVEKIKIENKQITGLAIINETTKKRCFVWQKERQTKKGSKKE